MSSFSPLGFPFLLDGVPGRPAVNDSLVLLDTYLRGVEAVQNNAPASPQEFDAYIVFGTPTGGDPFDGHANELAYRYGGQWRFRDPFGGTPSMEGLVLTNRADGTRWRVGGGVWSTEIGTHCSFNFASGPLSLTTSYQDFTLTATLLPASAYALAGSNKQIEVKTGGTYTVWLDVHVTADGSARDIDIGIGRNSTTPETASVRSHRVNASQTQQISTIFTRSFAAGDKIVPVVRQQVGSGSSLLNDGARVVVTKVGV